MMTPIADRTENFALRIVNALVGLIQELIQQKKYTFLELNKQLFRSETLYLCIKLLIKCQLFSSNKFNGLVQECNEIISILVTSINTKKSNQK